MSAFTLPVKGKMETDTVELRRKQPVGVNINTVLTTLVLGVVIYLAKMITNTNERMIRLEVQFEMVKEQSEKWRSSIEERLRELDRHRTP